MKKLKEKLSAKLSKTGGFTLVEMLIVVAIIAILIAVSIPLVSQALEKARDATDRANERAAKAEAVMVYMGVTDVLDDAGLKDLYTKGMGFVYDAKDGKLLKGDKSVGEKNGYGKCTGGHDKPEGWENVADHAKRVVGVWIDKDGTVTVGWASETTKAGDIKDKGDVNK